MNEQALLEAIYAAPDDDAPRLVYADALLERGDPRGELIVRQCQGDPARDLVEQHGDAWLGELAPIVASSTYERGFLATVTIREPRDNEAIENAVGHPLWHTVRELRGSIAIALDPVMTALRVLHVTSEPSCWRELLAGMPRPITELHYQPNVEERWENGGDITATPNSGGIWYRGFAHDEFESLAACSALPSLRRLVVVNTPPRWFATIVEGDLLDRVPVVESRNGPLHVRIAGGLASITVAPNASPYVTDVVLEVVRAVPEHLGLELHAPPHFAGRAIVERVAGRRMRR